MSKLVTLGLFLALSSSAIACEDAAAPTASKTAKVKTPKAVRFLPENTYSGFDGTHTFQAPVAVYESGDDLVVSAEDPTAVTIAEAKLAEGGSSKGKYFMLTVNKAGAHKLFARSKGQQAELLLTASQYSASDWALGEKRYASASVTGDPPCTQCHRDGAIDHSPAALAAVTDANVGTVITSGTTVFGTPIEINGQPGHKWAVGDEDRKTLVTYLRGLPPRGFQTP